MSDDKLRRTNAVGVTEKAHLRTDKEKFDSEMDRIFGEKKKFCDICDKRLSFCECEKTEVHNDDILYEYQLTRKPKTSSEA